MSDNVIQGPWNVPPVEWASERRHKSSAWATTPRSSGIHCKVCDRVFAAGTLPTDGVLVCRDCRIEADAELPEPHPELGFDA